MRKHDYFKEQAEQRELDNNRYVLGKITLSETEIEKILIDNCNFKIKTANKNIVDSREQLSGSLEELNKNIRILENKRINSDVEDDCERAHSENIEFNEASELVQDGIYVGFSENKIDRITKGTIQKNISRINFYINDKEKKIKNYLVDIEKNEGILNELLFKVIENRIEKKVA